MTPSCHGGGDSDVDSAITYKHPYGENIHEKSLESKVNLRRTNEKSNKIGISKIEEKTS